MSLLNPEKIFRSLVAGMGVTPEQIIGAINMMLTELNAIKSDREGFKVAASAMVKRYDERLASIDAKLDLLLSAATARNGIAHHAIVPINGAITHEVSDHE